MYGSKLSPPIQKRTGCRNNFQNELHSKLQDRRSKGLATDITESEDELASDDDMLGDFNMTSKSGGKGLGSTWAPAGASKKSSKYGQDSRSRSPFSTDPGPAGRKADARGSPYGDSLYSPHSRDQRKSPYQENKGSALDTIFGKSSSRKTPTYDDDDGEEDFGGGGDLMRTMRQPMNTWSGAEKGKAPNPKPRKGASSGHLPDARSPRDQKPWEPPSFRKASLREDSQEDKENRRAKSPGLFGRKSPADDLDTIGEDHDDEYSKYRRNADRGRQRPERPDDKKPKVTPRRLTPRDDKKKDVYDREGDRKKDSEFKRRSPTTDIFGSGRRTPSKEEDEFPARGGRKSPVAATRFGKDKDGRKTPTGGSKFGSKSPVEEKKEKEGTKKASILDFMGGDAPKEKGKKGSSKLLLDSDSDEGDSKRKGVPKKGDDRNPFGDRRSQRPQDRKLRKSPTDEWDRRSPSGRKEGRGRKSPSYPWDRKSPHEKGKEDRYENEGRRSPYDKKRDDDSRKSQFEKSREDRYKDGRKSPIDRNKDDKYDRDRNRRSPFEKSREDKYESDRKSPFGKSKDDKYSKSRKSPFEEEERDRRSPYDRRYRDEDDEDYRRSPQDRKLRGRKSPLDQDDDRYDRDKYRKDDRGRGVKDDYRREGRDRRGSFDEADGRGPWRDDHRPTLRWKDQEEGKYDDGYRRDRMEERDHRRSPFGEERPPSLRKDRSRDYDDFDDQERRRRPMARSPAKERDSSYCEELEREPEHRRPKQEETPQAKERKGKHRAQTAEKQVLENAIESIEDAQKGNRMKYIQPDEEESQKEAKVEEGRKTTKLKPTPRYGILPGETREDMPMEFNSTTDIRSAVYQEWLKGRTERAKKELAEKKKKEKEEEEKKKKDEQDKFLEAKASYKVWKEKKDETLKDKLRKKREEEQKKLQKEHDDKLEKQKEAELTFRSWKENKDAYLKEKARKDRRVDEEKKDDEDYTKSKKKKDAEKTYMRWKERKDNQLVKNKSRETQSAKDKEKEERRAQREREREAEERYEKWLIRKEKQDQQKKKHGTHTDEFTGAWCPAGRTIPFGR